MKIIRVYYKTFLASCGVSSSRQLRSKHVKSLSSVSLFTESHVKKDGLRNGDGRLRPLYEVLSILHQLYHFCKYNANRDCTFQYFIILSKRLYSFSARWNCHSGPLGMGSAGQSGLHRCTRGKWFVNRCHVRSVGHGNNRHCDIVFRLRGCISGSQVHASHGIIPVQLCYPGCGTKRSIGRFNDKNIFQYFIIVFLLFVTVLIGGVLAYVFREMLVNTVQREMSSSMRVYDTRQTVRDAWDITQSTVNGCFRTVQNFAQIISN